MVFTGNNDVEIDVRIRTDQAKEGFRQVETGLKGVEQEARKASSVLEDFSRGIVQGIGIGAATTAIAGLSNAFSSLPAAIERGAFVNDISESFQNLATAAGVSSDALINKFSSALGDTIPKVDAMQQANELLLGGLDPSQFELVAKAARAFGEVTGKDAKAGMDALTDSLLRGNDRALKSIGIIVDNEKAYRDYAKSIGTTADMLSEEGKVLATRGAVLDALSKKQKELGDTINDSGDSLESLSAAFTDQKDKVLSAVAGNDQLNAAIATLAQTVRSVDFQPMIDGITSLITVTSGLVTAGLKNIGMFTEGVKDLIRYGQILGDLDSKSQSKGGLDSLFSIFTNPGKALDTLALEKVTTATKKFISEGLDKAVPALLKTEDGLKKVGAASAAGSIDLGKVGEAHKKAGESAAKLAEKQAELRKEFNSTEGILKYRGEVEKIAEAYQDGITDFETYSRDLADLKTKYEENGGSAKNLADIIDGGLSDAITKGDEKIKKLGEDASKSLQQAQEDAKSLGESIGQIFAGGIGNLFKGDLKGGIGGIVSGLGGLFGGLGGKELGSLIGDSIGGTLGATIGSAFGPIGDALGSELGSLVVDGISSLFGGRDAQGKIRDSLDKLFADALKDNPVQAIIGGQLQSISDLDFLRGTKDYVNGTFDDLFQSLPDKAKAGFEGVAAGFTEIFGQGSELSSQLAAVFANNLGGSLNNLQLLVEATGKSFEDLKKGVVEAFLDGKLSALEAQTALNGIAQVSQKGIPDGIGMVAEAFDNLKNAGTKGGRALIDALQDIGFEAKELGDKTLEQVMQRLKATGKFSAAEIEQVFSELKKNGIDSVDKLTKATNEQLIPVLSALQAGGFGFKEQAKEVKDYVDAINQIPDRKSVVIDLKVNASDKDKEVINNLPRNKSGQGINSETGR